MLEASEHEFSAFVTLTYNEENLPKGNSLCKRDLQLFLKLLRKRIFPRLIRYYACGEYGTESLRPHYHLILFGISPLEADLVQRCWPRGFTCTGTAEAKSMSYVAQYVVKKMNHARNPKLMGREPEFQLMSRGREKGQGLGAGIVTRMHEQVLAGSVPADRLGHLTQVRIEGKVWPLGRYLTGLFRERIMWSRTNNSERIRALIGEQHAKVVAEGAATYLQKRRARAKASQGRILLKEGIL